MTTLVQPPLAAFITRLERELIFGQVLIRRLALGYELRHAEDAAAEPGTLRLLPIPALRPLAQRTAGGAFRPLRSAPNLPSGWRCEVADDATLESALQGIYPGALADWYAAQSAAPPVTHYREFTERQTGMYRISAKLNEAQAGAVIQAGCHRRFCLKQRLWTVGGLEADRPDEKSLIPCLEPCAVLLEFARKAGRIEQEEKAPLEMAPAELATLQAVLEAALARENSNVREADFNSPINPRRVQWLLARLQPFLRALPLSGDEEK